MTVDTLSETYDVAYQGAPGAFSETAAMELVRTSMRRLGGRTLQDVFSAVANRRARYGVVPLENTIAGTVPEVYELILAHELLVVAETRVRIDHALIGPGELSLGDVRRVLSHPVALGQCRSFLNANPQIEPVAVFDTAGAVEIAMAQRDGVTAAIAGERAAAIYGGSLLATRIQDHVNNWTRFALIARPEDAAGPSCATRMLVAFDLPHRPGSLVHALQPLCDRGVNLTKIESRPIATRPFEYRFVIELSMPDGQAVEDAIDAMRPRTVWLRVLGTYHANVEQGESLS